MRSFGWPVITEIVPEGSKGCAEIQHFDVSESQSRLSSLRGEYVPVGRYARLLINGQTMMSDTHHEKSTNREVIGQARGDVLIAGLGLGMILPPILSKPEVTRVVVIEKYQEVIDLVAPYYPYKNLEIVCADIFEWKPEKGVVFDTIYFDIWQDICTDNIKEINHLHRRARFWKRDQNAWVSSWMVDTLRYYRRREQREAAKWNY